MQITPISITSGITLADEIPLVTFTLEKNLYAPGSKYKVNVSVDFID